MPETSNHSSALPPSDTQKIIARGHTAIEIGQYLLPSNQPIINTLSGKRADLSNQLEEVGRRLDASGDVELKIRWDWKQRTKAEEGEEEMVDLMKESGMRLLDVIEAVWDWLRMQDDDTLSIDPKEFLLDLTERRHLQRLVSLIPSRLVLPHINVLLRASTQAASSINSPVISSIRTITTRLLRLITIPSEAQNQDDNQNQSSYRRSDLYMFLSSPTIIPFILLPPLLIGWSQAFPPDVFAEIRKGFLIYVDKGLAPSEALATLGGLQTILTSGYKSTSSPSSGSDIGTGSGAGAKIVPLEDDPIVYPEYARRTVKALMGRQMVRPGGVAGLLGNVFGFGERKDGKSGDDVLELHKLDYVTKLLGIPVHGMDAKAYYDNMFEQLRLIIVPSDPVRERNTPKHHVQATAYVLTKLAVTLPLIKRELQKALHEPLFPRFEDLPHAASSSSSSSLVQGSVVVTSATRINSLVSLLLPLLTLNPPPPPFLNLIMTPIIRPIFLLWQHLKKDKTADPLTRKEIEDVVGAWVRLMDVELVENGLWEVLQGGRGWKGLGFGGRMDDEEKVLFWGRNFGPSESREEEDIGAAVLYGRPPQSTTDNLKFSSDPEDFNLTTKLNDLHVLDVATVPDAGQDYDILPDLSSLQMYPDPELLVAIIVRSGRADLSSRFLVRCLQAYQVMSGDNDANPERTLILLQVIMRLSDKASANLGKEVRHVLLFIEHALQPSSTADEIDIADSDDGADSDDEDADDAAEPAAANDVVKEDIPNLGLVETALNLLVTTLHGDGTITSESQPILKPIEKHVEALLKHRLADIRQAARAASLLLAVRKATPGLASNASATDTAQRYQESLRLLQDPILAVRAHGLIILQSIVRAPDFDRALTPAIMDIFLSAIRDDDSFMYLNAVKGLSSLVDGLGREVMASITLAYVEGFERITEFKPDELDRRLRLGEALQQSIRRAGTALSGYVQPIVPRLLRVFPNASLPTVIRSSSLSILATCADTEWRALLPWSNDLIGSCLDLLRLESVSQRRNQSNSTNSDNNGESEDKDENEGEEDDDTQRPNDEPTRSNDSKHPALRRAAVVFLGLMFDSIAKAAAQDTDNDSHSLQPEIRINTRPATRQNHPAPVDAHLVQSARTVLSYIKHTDVDSLTSHQAGEVLQILRHIPAST